MSAELLALAERVEQGRGLDNALDVMVEVAVWDEPHIAIRANNAGTKVIYTENGKDTTCWAPEWTADRKGTAAALRARAALSTKGEGADA